MNTFSVVIRALNEGEHLPNLLDEIARQSIRPDQLILVDSGSTDDTVRIATDRGARIVRISPDEFSFGRALNRGCAAATGDVLVFASAHVYPRDEFWLERLTKPFSFDDRVALVYGRQAGDSRNHFSEIQVMRKWFPELSDLDQRHPFCNNANCAIRRTWWEELPYDESLTGLEDVDWAKRALARGGKLVYAADAGIVHVHEEGFTGIRNRYRREAIAHRRIFSDQHIGLVSSTALFLAHVGRDFLAAARHRQLLQHLVDIPVFRAAQHLGTWEGFRTRDVMTDELRRRFYYPKGIEGLRAFSVNEETTT